MNILFLSQLLPYPPDSGAKVRSYYTIRYLAQKHRVSLLAFARPDDPPNAIEHLREICSDVQIVQIQRNKLKDILTAGTCILNQKSFIIERDFFDEMARKVDQMVRDEDYEAVHTDQLWMAQYAQRAKSKNPDLKLILDEHNACYQIFQRLAKGEFNLFKRSFLEWEWRRLRRYEAGACAQCDHIVTVTQEDQETLRNLIRENSGQQSDLVFSTIPICVDTGDIQPVEYDTGSRNIFYMGTMFYPPNIEGMLWFAREVWPLVLAQIPQTTLTIVGKNPPPEIQKLTRAVRGGEKIEVAGYISDPRPYLKKAGAFIIPLLAGGGMRVKIVDAWRWGLPIVSTSIGAEGIDYCDSDNILIADGAVTFAKAVVRIFLEPGLARRLSKHGRRWVEQKYDWQAVYPAWDQIYPSISPSTH